MTFSLGGCLLAGLAMALWLPFAILKRALLKKFGISEKREKVEEATVSPPPYEKAKPQKVKITKSE